MRLVLPSREDDVVAGVSRLTGGPAGRHSRGRALRWLTPLRAVLVLTVLTCTLGYLAKAPCRTHPWSDEYQYTRTCYTDVYALYFSEQLGARALAAGGGRLSVPYRDHPVEYPPVIGGLMWAAAEVTNLVHPDQPAVVGGVTVDDRGSTFFDLTALLLAAFALLTTWAVARLAGRQRIWDAAMVALAPTLLLHAYTNWDLAVVALAMLGLWAWSRERTVLAGVFLGLGAATKLYPALLVLVLGLLCLRAGRVRAWLRAAAAAAVTFVLAYLPAVLLSAATPAALRRSAFLFPSADPSCPRSAYHYLPGWRWFWTDNTTRGSDWDSLWLQLEHLRGHPIDNASCGAAPVWLNVGVALATVAVVVLVGLLVFCAPRRPRVAQLAFLLLAGFLLVNKVDSPQYVLWLVPLAALARPRWRAFLLWQATEVVVLLTRFYFFVNNDTTLAGHGGAGLPIRWFFLAVDLRDLALLAVMALVVREVLRPDLDVVRRGGVDDPAGGTLSDAPDRLTARASSRLVPA